MDKQKKPLILVLEDEKSLARAIKSKLELSCFEVTTARSVKEAISFMGAGEVDIIWLDHYLLGEENGLDFVEKLKKNKKNKNIPIFVVSNTATSDKVKSYINLGVIKYYTKSDCRLDEVIKEIKDFLGVRGNSKGCQKSK